MIKFTFILFLVFVFCSKENKQTSKPLFNKKVDSIGRKELNDLIKRSKYMRDAKLVKHVERYYMYPDTVVNYEKYKDKNILSLLIKANNAQYLIDPDFKGYEKQRKWIYLSYDEKIKEWQYGGYYGLGASYYNRIIDNWPESKCYKTYLFQVTHFTFLIIEKGNFIKMVPLSEPAACKIYRDEYDYKSEKVGYSIYEPSKAMIMLSDHFQRRLGRKRK